MPTLTIDNRIITVPEGTQVIDAAEQLGIMIPRFCYHPALGAVGACRMCAVMFLDGPVKGLQMSCMTKAMDGMVVSTTHAEAVDFRCHVIEWLMLNHPHDCPVCDEGGHCLLQDETISGGHSRRIFRGKKRTYRNQDLGPLVQHEMNRCIHCYRCARFYQEYAGYRDYGALGIGARLYFGRFEDGRLESPFSGNLIDLCPTGVLTDKPSRYKTRHWDLERGPSLCLHCSLGCNVTANGRYRELIRLEDRPNPRVQGRFLCDRGRYGYGYTNDPERPRLNKVDGVTMRREEALDRAAERLRVQTAVSGGKAVAVLGSGRNSLESQLLLARLCRESNWQGPFFTADPERGKLLAGMVDFLNRDLAAGPADLEECDLLLAVGIDPLNEAPMLALSLRQAIRRGGRLLALDPRPLDLPCDFAHIAAPPSRLPLLAASLVKQGLAGTAGPEVAALLESLPGAKVDPDYRAEFETFVKLLKESRRPALLCGCGLGSAAQPPLLLGLARALQAAKGCCRFFFDSGGPNSLGSAGLSSVDGGFHAALSAIETGEVRALLVVEGDPFREYPDRERLRQALRRLDLLLVLDYLPTMVFRQAHIGLPTATVFEGGGSFVNQAGLIQYASPVYRSGLPLHLNSQESHPPRHFNNEVPMGETSSAFATLLALAGKLGIFLPRAEADPWSLLPEGFSAAAQLKEAGYPADGISLLPESIVPPGFSGLSDREAASGDGGTLIVLAVEGIFGTEELSSSSGVARDLAAAPRAFVHTDDGAAAGLSDGCRVKLDLEGKSVELEIGLAENMARGFIVLPRHYKLREQLSAWPRSIRAADLQIVNG